MSAHVLTYSCASGASWAYQYICMYIVHTYIRTCSCSTCCTQVNMLHIYTENLSVFLPQVFSHVRPAKRIHFAVALLVE